MSILNVDNLTFGFGDKIILKDISFRLLKGEHAGLVGANGAGKTTLFNLLTGKLVPDEGSIRWVSSAKAGYLDQHIQLDDEGSIFDNLRSAFNDLYAIEEKVLSISNQLSGLNQHDMDIRLRELGRLQDRLLSSDFYFIDSIIKNVSEGLGLTALGLDTKAGLLSGGQRTKVSLAKLLLQKPELLLLDEPTNYLDKEHVEWLTNYLINYPESFIVISHDNEFMNSITNVIFHIEFCSLKRYPGNYEYYLKASETDRERYISEYNRQQEKIARMERFIQANIVRASTTKRAQSRQKQLGRIERLEKPQKAPKPFFTFLCSRDPGKLIFSCINLNIGYYYPVIEDLTLTLSRGEKVAVTGCNGIGKSTLLKTLMGIIPRLKGTIQYGEYLLPAYFEQENKNISDNTALQEVWNDFPDKTQKEIREGLAKCGLKQEHVLRSMKELSGGEQSKVRLCKLMMTPSNWLILDEPTNHLDVDSKAALKEALIKYSGTVILVCHEDDFYKDVVSRVWNMENYVLTKRI